MQTTDSNLIACPGSLEAALEALLASLALRQNDEAFTKGSELKAEGQLGQAFLALEHLNPKQFHFALTHPMSKLVSYVGSQRFAMHSDGMFLFEQYAFLRAHFRELFEQHEGSSCCVDKAWWVLSALARHFALGEPVVLNFDQAYTFHLPEKIFNTQEKLLSMFKALRRLHGGRPDLYILELQKLLKEDGEVKVAN